MTTQFTTPASIGMAAPLAQLPGLLQDPTIFYRPGESAETPTQYRLEPYQDKFVLGSPNPTPATDNSMDKKTRSGTAILGVAALPEPGTMPKDTQIVGDYGWGATIAVVTGIYLLKSKIAGMLSGTSFSPKPFSPGNVGNDAILTTIAGGTYYMMQRGGVDAVDAPSTVLYGYLFGQALGYIVKTVVKMGMKTKSPLDEVNKITKPKGETRSTTSGYKDE